MEIEKKNALIKEVLEASKKHSLEEAFEKFSGRTDELKELIDNTSFHYESDNKLKVDDEAKAKFNAIKIVAYDDAKTERDSEGFLREGRFKGENSYISLFGVDVSVQELEKHKASSNQSTCKRYTDLNMQDLKIDIHYPKRIENAFKNKGSITKDIVERFIDKPELHLSSETIENKKIMTEIFNVYKNAKIVEFRYRCGEGNFEPKVYERKLISRFDDSEWNKFLYTSVLVPLPYKLIDENANHLSKRNWTSISQYQELTKEFIHRHYDKIDFDALANNPFLRDDVCREFSDRIDPKLLLKTSDTVSEELKAEIKEKGYYEGKISRDYHKSVEALEDQKKASANALSKGDKDLKVENKPNKGEHEEKVKAPLEVNEKPVDAEKASEAKPAIEANEASKQPENVEAKSEPGVQAKASDAKENKAEVKPVEDTKYTADSPEIQDKVKEDIKGIKSERSLKKYVKKLEKTLKATKNEIKVLKKRYDKLKLENDKLEKKLDVTLNAIEKYLGVKIEFDENDIENVRLTDLEGNPIEAEKDDKPEALTDNANDALDEAKESLNSEDKQEDKLETLEDKSDTTKDKLEATEDKSKDTEDKSKSVEDKPEDKSKDEKDKQDGPKISEKTSEEKSNVEVNSNIDKDKAYEIAKYCIAEGSASINKVKKEFKLGFEHAKEYVEYLEEKHVFGKQESTKPREILVDVEGLDKIFNDDKEDALDPNEKELIAIDEGKKEALEVKKNFDEKGYYYEKDPEAGRTIRVEALKKQGLNLKPFMEHDNNAPEAKKDFLEDPKIDNDPNIITTTNNVVVDIKEEGFKDVAKIRSIVANEFISDKLQIEVVERGIVTANDIVAKQEIDYPFFARFKDQIDPELCKDRQAENYRMADAWRDYPEYFAKPEGDGKRKIERIIPLDPYTDAPAPKKPKVEVPVPRPPRVEKAPVPRPPRVEKVPVPKPPKVEKIQHPKLPKVEVPVPRPPKIEVPVPKPPKVEVPVPRPPKVEKNTASKTAKLEAPVPRPPKVEKAPTPKAPVPKLPKLPRLPEAEKTSSDNKEEEDIFDRHLTPEEEMEEKIRMAEELNVDVEELDAMFDEGEEMYKEYINGTLMEEDVEIDVEECPPYEEEFDEPEDYERPTEYSGDMEDDDNDDDYTDLPF